MMRENDGFVGTAITQEDGFLGRLSSMFVPDFEAPVTPLALPNDETLLLEMHNQARREAGSPPLVLHPGLSRAAIIHADDMVEKDYFSHTSKDGTTFGTRVKRYYKGSWLRGENIAYNSLSGSAAVRRAMGQWLGSPGHKRNILDPRYREVGFGVIHGSFKGSKVTMFVADFGSR